MNQQSIVLREGIEGTDYVLSGSLSLSKPQKRARNDLAEYITVKHSNRWLEMGRLLLP